jgi:hypothetical protein
VDVLGINSGLDDIILEVLCSHLVVRRVGHLYCVSFDGVQHKICLKYRLGLVEFALGMTVCKAVVAFLNAGNNCTTVNLKNERCKTARTTLICDERFPRRDWSEMKSDMTKNRTGSLFFKKITFGFGIVPARN